MEKGRAKTVKDDSFEGDSSYHLRSKRRKLEIGEEYEISKPPSEGRKKSPIAFMPTEMLQKIMGYVGYEDLGKNVRLVNHKFKSLAEAELNKGCKKQNRKILALYRTTTDSVQATENDEELRNLCKLMNMLEILMFQQSILVSTVWRYVDNTFYRIHKNYSSLYAGELLDLYETFIWKFTHHPDQLCDPAVCKNYNYPPEVNSIIRLTKLFCLNFEKLNEEPLNCNAFISGCKIVDILDCSKYAKKRIVYERLKNNVLEAMYSYEFPKSWFIVMPIAPERCMSWQQQQKLMYMRLRRISLAHTEMELKQTHYEREHMLRPAGHPTLPGKPNDSVYTGYGDVNDNFFYYGTMNEGSYFRKFYTEMAENAAGQDEEEMDDIDENSEPFLGIKLDVTLKCPIKYAPWEYLLKNEEAARSSSSLMRKKKFSLELTCQCPGASYLNLPQRFIYEVKHSQ